MTAAGRPIDCMFDCFVSQQGDVTVLVVTGEIDAAAAPLLFELISKIAGAQQGALLLDLDDVIFMDGAVIDSLMKAWGALPSQHRQLGLSGLPARAHSVLRQSGGDKLFAIYPTAEDGITQMMAA